MGVTSLSLFVISIGRDLNDLTPLDLKRTHQQLRPRNTDWLNAISHFFTYSYYFRIFKKVIQIMYNIK